MLLCRIWSKIVLFVCLFKLEFLVFSSSIHRIHNILSCLKSIWLDKIIIAWQHARMYQRNHIFFLFLISNSKFHIFFLFHSHRKSYSATFFLINARMSFWFQFDKKKRFDWIHSLFFSSIWIWTLYVFIIIIINITKSIQTHIVYVCVCVLYIMGMNIMPKWMTLLNMRDSHLFSFCSIFFVEKKIICL